MTDSIIPADDRRPEAHTHRTSTGKRSGQPAITIGVIVVALAALVIGGYSHFNGPNVTAQKGDNLVTIMGGDYPKAIRYADQFDMLMTLTPLGGTSRPIDAKEALSTDTDRSLVNVHLCPGDQVDAQFRWRYVKAANSACHRGTR